VYVPITQSEVKVELIASFDRHSNLVGSQLMILRLRRQKQVIEKQTECLVFGRNKNSGAGV
jgi:hypothetical protein